MDRRRALWWGLGLVATIAIALALILTLVPRATAAAKSAFDPPQKHEKAKPPGPSEEAKCSLPTEEAKCSLPREEAKCSLPREEAKSIPPDAVIPSPSLTATHRIALPHPVNVLGMYDSFLWLCNDTTLMVCIHDQVWQTLSLRVFTDEPIQCMQGHYVATLTQLFRLHQETDCFTVSSIEVPQEGGPICSIQSLKDTVYVLKAQHVFTLCDHPQRRVISDGKIVCLQGDDCIVATGDHIQRLQGVWRVPVKDVGWARSRNVLWKVYPTSLDLWDLTTGLFIRQLDFIAGTDAYDNPTGTCVALGTKSTIAVAHEDGRIQRFACSSPFQLVGSRLFWEHTEGVGLSWCEV